MLLVVVLHQIPILLRKRFEVLIPFDFQQAGNPLWKTIVLDRPVDSCGAQYGVISLGDRSGILILGGID